MSRKKRPNSPSPTPPAPAGPLPVLNGNCFATFIDEARSIGNEVAARRQFDADIMEYLKQKSLLEEWSAWYDARRAPKP